MRRRDPRPYIIPPPLQRPRFRHGKGRRYVPDVVERVRVLIVGTTWPEEEIAERVGVGVATVHGWKIARGWQRPDGASISTRKVSLARAGLTRRCREALRTIEARAASEILRLGEEPTPDRERLNRAVAIVIETRRGLQIGSKPSREAFLRLACLASRELHRLGIDEAEPVALARARDLLHFALNALYRVPWRPKEA
jgi:hypothetical protein